MSSPGSAGDVVVDDPVQAGIEYVQDVISPGTHLQLVSKFLDIPETGVRLHYIRGGPSLAAAKGVLLFVHGWPDCWFGWRYQLAYFAARGYVCLVPDQRGFGESRLLAESARTHAENYAWQLACEDLRHLCRAEQVQRVVVVGHDWGGGVVWSFVRRYPYLAAGVAALCTPYRPAKSSYVPLEEIAKLRPLFQYQVYFARHRKAATKELDQDPARSLAALFRTGDRKDAVGALPDAKATGFLDKFPSVIPDSPLLTAEERAIYTAVYRKSGFETGLCWYATSRLNWEQEGWHWKESEFDVRKQDEWRALQAKQPHPPEQQVRTLSPLIATPALMVTASNDRVLTPKMTVGMENWVANLQRVHVEGAAHWLQAEKPNQVNEGLLQFVDSLGEFKNEPVPTQPTQPTATGRGEAAATGNSQTRSKL